MNLKPSHHPYAKLAVLLVLGCSLVGCGHSYKLSRPGTTSQQYSQDQFECRQLSMKPSFGTVGGNVAGSVDPDWQTYKLCLEGRGYTVTEE